MPWQRAKPTKAVRAPARRALFCALLLACAALTACDALDAPAAQTAAGPDLRQVTLPAWEDTDPSGSETQTAGEDYVLVDLWLDATQNMGGISTNADSIYLHMGKKYREGGFHYHYGTLAGWYESLLGDFLNAAGDARVRTLRYGNETIPEETLQSYGLLPGGSAAKAAVWRDLHTVAQETEEGFFTLLSAEDMSQSFYALGAREWLTRMATFDPQRLENPSLFDAMAAVQTVQADAIAAKNEAYLIQQGQNEEQCALYGALPNLDLRRLSIITVDPASLRRVSGTDESGKTVAYYETLLRELGVFDAGLCVGVLDFQLDYLGQMSTFTTADLSEPLVWGRAIFDKYKGTFENLGVMPRRMLTLVVGTRAQVDGFIGSLSTAIDGDRNLRGLRGPQNGELQYAANGQSVTQQPFSFAWNHTVIARPSMGYYTQQTEGAALSADAAALDTAESGLPLLRFTPDAQNRQPDRTVTLRLPVEDSSEEVALDVSRLTGASLTAVNSVLLSRVLPNTAAQQAAAQGAPHIVYRDKIYVFETGADSGAFSLAQITQENGALLVTLKVAGALLKTGYYRLRLAADATGEQVTWASVPWIDGAESVSVPVSDAQVYEWETFTVAIAEFDSDSKSLPRMFQHAWGGYTEKLYHGFRVPDFPPVYLSPRLQELAAQLRGAAAAEVSPLIRYTFEVFVPGP